MGDVMFKPVLLCLLLLWSISVRAATNLQLNIRVDAYSEPVPIQAFTDDWIHALREGGERAFAQGEVSLGAKNEQYAYGLLWRYDYLLSFTPDMARLYHQYANQNTVEPNQTFDLHLNASHVEAYGVYAAQKWQVLPDWSLWTGLSILQGQHIVEGQFSGCAASKMAIKNIDRIKLIQTGIDYVYDRPALHEDELGWNPAAPEGEGFGLNLALNGKISPNWRFKTEVRDLMGYMYWRKMPRTAYQLHFDDQKNPPHDLRGQLNIAQNYRQRLPWQANTQLIYQPEGATWRTDVQVSANRVGQLWQIGAYQSWRGYEFGVHVEPQSHAVGLSFKNQYLQLFYLTDHLNSNQAHRLSLGLSGVYYW